MNIENLKFEFTRLKKQDQNKILMGLTILKESKTPVILVGGGSVVCYLQKNRDLTPDLDFICQNLEEMISFLHEKKIAIKDLIDSRGKYLGIGLIDYNIDILSESNFSFPFKKLLSTNSKSIFFNNHNLNMISPELLVIMKFTTSREKDINDAFLLLGSEKLSKEKYLNCLNELKIELKDDFDTLIIYAELIKD